jgi:hypothetical protein
MLVLISSDSVADRAGPLDRALIEGVQTNMVGGPRRIAL